MRYCDSGRLHMDFYRTLNGTIAYLCGHYGEEFLDEIFRRTGRSVYRAIRRDLLDGDPKHLLEHWSYYFGREGGHIEIERREDEIVMRVEKCPAIGYLQDQGIEPDPAFCRQTELVNRALAEGTPFEITTRVRGDGRCVQTIRRRRS